MQVPVFKVTMLGDSGVRKTVVLSAAPLTLGCAFHLPAGPLLIGARPQTTQSAVESYCDLTGLTETCMCLVCGFPPV